MRRAAIVAITLAACSVAPPPPVEHLLPPPSAPPSPPAISLMNGPKLVARDGAGRELWELTTAPIDFMARHDGSACVLERDNACKVVRVDPQGRVLWSTSLGKTSHNARIVDCGSDEASAEIAHDVGDDRAPRATAHVLVLDALREGTLYVLEDEKGGVVRQIPATAARLDDQGELFVADHDAVAKMNRAREHAWRVRLRVFPPSDPSGSPSQKRHLAIAGGVLLTGADDGSIVGLDDTGRARFQLGVRGAVRGIEARPAGDFVVTTDAGVVAVIDREGRTRWQTWLGPDEVSPPAVLPDGRVIVSTKDGALHMLSAEGAPLWHEPTTVDVDIAPRVLGGVVLPTLRYPPFIKLDLAGEHPPPLRATPTVAYRVDGMGRGATLGLVATSPHEAWALVGQKRMYPSMKPARVHRWDGVAFRDLGPPKVPLAKEVFVQGGPKVTGEMNPRELVRGPSGAPIIVAARDHELSDAPDAPSDMATARAVALIDVTPNGFRERREMFSTFASIAQRWSSGYGEPRYAASPSGKEALCVADRCVLFGGGKGIEVRPSEVERGPIAFVGEVLWRGGATVDKRWDANAIMRGDEVILPKAPSGIRPPIHAIWGRSADDVWLLFSDYAEPMLGHARGDQMVARRSPVGDLRAVWSSGPKDVWIGGARGVARFDGKRWARVAGVRGKVSTVTGSGPDDVWIGTDDDIFHVTRTGDVEPFFEPPLPPPPIATITPEIAATVDSIVRIERVAIAIDKKPTLRGALGVVEGPGGVTWLHDGHRVIEVEGDKARVLHHADGGSLACQRCLAPIGAGEGFALSPGLVQLAAARARSAALPMTAITALSRAPSGDLWAVSAADDDGLPHVLVRGERGLRMPPGAPRAAYNDVSARAGDDVWLAGGLVAGRDDTRPWPAGEGILAHFDGRAFTHHRAPDGALLAVASAGPREAWAVGVEGSIVHATASAVAAMRLARKDTKPAPLLRAVSVGPRGDVWIAGDDATLLRFDPRGLSRIDTTIAGARAAFTGIVAPSTRPGWLVGPGGVYRVIAAP